MKEIRNYIEKEKEKRIGREIIEIEAKYDSNRMYKAVRNIQRMKEKVSLEIECEGGMTTDEEKQIDIVSEVFGEIFKTEDGDDIEDIPPKPMKTGFNEEIRQAITRLKDNKSPGVDNITTAKHLKN